MKKKAKAVECDALNGDGKAWAVLDGDGYTIYEAEFCEATAKELSLLCDSMPKATWERHRQVLERVGCDIRDPAEVSNARTNLGYEGRLLSAQMPTETKP